MTKTQGWRVAKKRANKKIRITPIAPSKNEVKFYESYLKKVKRNNSLPNRVLILGATPEIRDAAIKNGLETYAVDLSKQMLDKFSLLMKYCGHKLDRRVVKNWLKMSYPKFFFGAALGDGSLVNLVTKKDNVKLISILKKIIAPEGYIVIRQLVYPESFQPIKEAKQLVSKYRKKQISWYDFFTELRIYTFKKEVYNKRTYQYDAAKNFKLIDKLYQDGVITKKEHKKVSIFRNNVINTFYPEKEFIKMIESKGFKLFKTFHDKPDRLFKYVYMFTFVKK